jgi:type VI secretion system protein ImpF
LIDGTVRVTAEVSTEEMSVNALRFTIAANLWAQPLPLNLYLRAEVDLDTGHFEVSEAAP